MHGETVKLSSGFLTDTCEQTDGRDHDTVALRFQTRQKSYYVVGPVFR